MGHAAFASIMGLLLFIVSLSPPPILGCVNADVGGLPWVADHDEITGSRLAVRGSLVFTASSALFTIFDASDPFAPVQLGSTWIGSGIVNFSVTDDLAFATTYESADHYAWTGMVVIDIADPTAPHVVGSLTFPLGPDWCDILAVGEFAYATVADEGLRILDISDPAAPLEIDTISLSMPRHSRLASKGDYMYIAADSLWTLDVSQPGAPEIVHGQSLNSHYTSEEPLVCGDRLVIATGVYPVIYDLSNPAAPVRMGQMQYAPSNGMIAAGDDKFFLAAEDRSVSVYDTSGSLSPWTPRISGTPIAFLAQDMAYVGNAVYVIQMLDGLQILNASAPEGSPIPLATLDSPSAAMRISSSDARICLVTEEHGLMTAIASNPSSPSAFGSYPGLVEHPVDVVLVDGRMAYVLNSSFSQPQLIVVDTHNPMDPVVIGQLESIYGSSRIVVEESVAYIAAGSWGVHIIDITTPSHPVLLSTYDETGFFRDIAVSEGVAYLAHSTAGLSIVDVSDPTQPRLLGSRDGLGRLDCLTLDGSLVYATGTGSGLLHVIDVSDPAAPLPVGEVGVPLDPHALGILDTFLYLATANGVIVIDIMDPSQPGVVGVLEADGPANDICISRGRLLVASGSTGLAVFDPQCPISVPIETRPAPQASPAMSRIVSASPNPFNPATLIEFEVRSPGPVEITIHDAAGRRIAVIESEPLPTGRHRRRWDGRDDTGRATASGTYLVRMRTDDGSDSRRLLLLR